MPAVAAPAPPPVAHGTAAQGQRLGALGRLAGGLAHDFNNLLGIVSNNTYLLQERASVEETQALIESTLRAVENGSQLTQHVMRVAHPPPACLQRVDPAQALPDMRQTLRGLLGSRLAVHAEVAPGTAPVWADPAELSLALLNLALNALDAMPRARQLHLKASNASGDGLGDLPALDPPRHYVQLEVRDDGGGMPPEVAERAFTPFFTTRPAGQGLGLAQVQGFCQQAGGVARIESTPGAGTTVTLLLPCMPVPARSFAFSSG
jgi:signal transduction histidine kinase